MTVHDLHKAPRVNTPDVAFPARPRPAIPAHVIETDAEAIRIAHQLAEEFAKDAALRDRESLLPLAELDAFSQSGLWGITVPKAYGGAGVSYVTLTEVIKIISAADPSLGQIPQNHLAIVEHIVADGTDEQKRFLFGEVLRGVRFGNAFSEAASRVVTEFETKLTKSGDDYVVNGRKFYATGALLAHIVPIVAVDAQGQPHLAFADRDAPGLTIVNDWSSFGQRTTASGTVIVDNVRVPAERVLPAHRAFDRPTAAGPISQIIQGAVDTGIAKGTIVDTIAFVRTTARPWVDSGQSKAWEDHFTIAAIGDLEIRLHAAEAILEKAARLIDAALIAPDEQTVAEAAVATAEAKVLSTEVAIQAANKLFELGGARSTLAAHGLDRHWRNARTHTLHDPVRWKYFHVGDYYLNGIKPARHPWL
ncbi:SfnB family sulfur acquisition oxidoreductase [Chelatococcus reniformis]|uniref:Dibenzothiophene monooxygenase n=1 Tax=Chelatococcus reniformis TaxID=1494448 RepID=A0A916X9I2_9HYPH|nr:SfnB family sulfur acquisition oxidoreductase [Chelatococcus reniformis]GGC54657.1 SfnB family sulfur acquisition oxidoreductase [Chelatococcus reniformis]